MQLRVSALFIRLLAGLVTATMIGCASTPKHAVQPAGLLLAEQRAERLRRLLPANSFAIMRMQYDEVERDLRLLPEIVLDGIGTSMGWGSSVDAHVDKSRSLVIAAAPLGGADFLHSIWLGAPVMRVDSLPTGMLMRFIVPSDDPEALIGALREKCAKAPESERICYTLRRTRATQEHAVVDFVGATTTEKFAMAGRILEEADAKGDALPERDTPALRHFLEGDATVAIYARVDRLWELHATQLAGLAESRWAAELMATEEKVVFDTLARLHGTWLADVGATHFEDISVRVSIRRDESDDEVLVTPRALVADVVATYTEAGRRYYAERQPELAELPSSGVGSPMLEVTWLPGGADADFDEPYWKGKGGAAMEKVAVEMSSEFVGSWLWMLESPPLFVRGPLDEFLRLSAAGAVSTLGPPPHVMLNFVKLTDPDRARLVEGPRRGGAQPFTLVFDWARPVEEATRAQYTGILKQQLGAEADIEWHVPRERTTRVLVSREASFASGPVADQPGIATVTADLDAAGVAALFASAKLGDTLRVRSVPSTHYHRLRVQVGSAASVMPAVGALEVADGFEPLASQPDWRMCMIPLRAKLARIATGEDLLFTSFFERSHAMAKRCAEKYPDHADEFHDVARRWEKAGELYYPE